MQRRHLLAGAAGLAASALAGRSAAAAWPDRAVKVVVPYPAGGVVDVATRIVTDGLAAEWGQPVVVENRAGANGNIGAQAVKAAPADGHTLLVGSMFIVVNPLIDRNARFAADDFLPIASIGAAPNLLVVPAASPAATLKDFVAQAKRRPGELNTPNPGSGSSNHLGLELLQQEAGIELTQINYKGQPPFVVDLVNGQLHFAFMTAALALPHIASGRLRALAVGSQQRLKQLPEVPTLAEAGFGEATVLPWNGFLAPAGTPAAVAERIAADVEKVLRSADSQRRHEAMSAELPRAPREFARFVAAERTRWQRVVAQRRITAEAA